MAKDNVARRFKNLVSEAAALPPNLPLADAWRSILQLPAASTGVLLARLGPVYQLPLELRTAIEPHLVPGFERHFLAWEPHVDHAFSAAHLGGQWAAFRDPLQHHEVASSLTACELAFEQNPGLELPADERLDELRQQVCVLADDVRGAAGEALGPRVQDFILKHLQEIDAAIGECRFRGVASIEEAAERAAGAYALRPDVRAKANDPLIARYTRVLRALILTFRVAHGGLQLAEAFEGQLDRLLPAGIADEPSTPPASLSDDRDT